MVDCTVIRRGEQKTSAWSGGTTTELFIYPENAVYAERNFEIRISSATVDLEESSFTSLAGYTRYIMPLKGTMRLIHKGHHEAELKPLETDIFMGDWSTECFGKCVDFNLMHTKGWDGALNIVEKTCRISCVCDGVTALYALSDGIPVTVSGNGGVIFSEALNTGDFFVIISKADSGRHTAAALEILAGTGENSDVPLAVWAQAEKMDAIK